MKPKQTLLTVCALAALLLLQNSITYAQAWSINGNAGIAAGTNYLGTSDPNDLVFRSNAIERGRLLGTTGEWRFGTATNYMSLDVNGRLRFTGPQAAYQVAGNRYAFQYTGDPDYGLFFNSTAVQYEFRNGSAVPVFLVNANTGAATFSGALTVGNYTLPATDGSNNQVLKTNGSGTLNWANDNNTTYTAGSGLSLVGTTFNNTAPDQTVTLAGTNGITTSGTYPNFTVNGAGLWRTIGNAGTTPGTNFVGTTDAQPLAFRTSNIEKMRILADGKVGIGTTVPTARLHINGTSGEDAMRIQTNGTTRLFVDDAGGVSIGSLTPGPAGGLYVSGNVGIGNTAPINKLDVSGNVGISGNLDASGTVGFGSVETFSDGGSNTIQSNSNIIPNSTNSWNLGSSALRWNGAWLSGGFVTSSDARLKKNIRDLNYGLKEIMQLHAVKYNLKDGAEQDKDKLGVIAQEIQKVIPEVVVDYDISSDEATGKPVKVPSTTLGVNYTALIPVLIRSIQEQQKLIEDLQLQVAQLTKNVPAVTAFQSGAVNNITVSSASLDQNVPNPLKGSTSIKYSIPGNAHNAALLITDLNGKSIRQIPLNKAGTGVVNIDASTLSNGTYHYTLLIDGRQIETKKMVIAR